MAPEFIPVFVCFGLIIASVAACILVGCTALIRRHGPLFLMAAIPTAGLPIVTGLCARGVRQQFFLNEPMAIAADQGDVDEVRRLLDRGASPDSWGVDSVNTALIGAARHGHARVVQLLLERGANPAISDGDRKSALQHAREGGHQEVVRLLEREPR
jgi:hypothetical protein